MKRHTVIVGLVAGALALGSALFLFADSAPIIEKAKNKLKGAPKAEHSVPPPAITALRVKKRDFVETVLVTGSFVPRDEVFIVPELEGLRTVELLADEGDRVETGEVLARLEDATLKYQLAQRKAGLDRAEAQIAQAKSQIAEAQARQREADSSLERAKPLVKKKYIAESVVDQRRAAAESAKAQVAAAEDGLRVAEASKAELEAQLRELEWRLSRTEVKAPVAGLISSRNARIGEIAIGANAFTDTPMFRLIAKNEIELDADVPETEIAKLEAGQKAVVEVTGVGEVEGQVRLVSPEIDKTTRLGKVRIFMGDDRRLKIGSFARGRVETRRASGLSVPLSSLIYTQDGPRVLVVEDGQAKSRSVTLGLVEESHQQVTFGLKAGEIVVAKAGTFLRDGDAVKAVLPEERTDRSESKLSEAR